MEEDEVTQVLVTKEEVAILLQLSPLHRDRLGREYAARRTPDKRREAIKTEIETLLDLEYKLKIAERKLPRMPYT